MTDPATPPPAPPPPGDPSSPSSPPPRNDRIAVVLNGNARSVTHEIVSLLDQIVLGGDLYVSRSLEEGEQIADAIVFRGYGTVLTGGGDGTFVHMVTHVVKAARARGVAPPRFGILRLGTGNALAWVLGNSPPRRGMGLAADIARLRREGGCRTLRLLDVDGRLTPFAGLGIDARALAQMIATKKFFARTPVLRRFASSGLTYLTAITTQTLPYFVFRAGRDPVGRIVNEGATAFRLGPDGRMVGAPIERGEVVYEGPARMIAAATIPYYGFGFRIFPFADERPDRMNLRVINIRSVDVPPNIVKIHRGTYRDPERIFDYLVDRVRIEYAEPMPMQIGGDPAGERAQAHFALSNPIEMVDFYAPTPLGRDERSGPQGDEV